MGKTATAPAPGPIPAVEKGYYKLTKDVKNPRPDRRSNRYDSRELWKAGTLVKVHGPGGGAVGMVTFPDNSYVMFGGGGTSKANAEQRAGDEIARNIEPAPDTLGIVLRESGPDGADVLAFMLDTGKLTLDDVKAALAGIDALDPVSRPDELQGEKNYNDMRRRNGLVVYGV